MKYDPIQRDRFGFKAGGAQSQIAALIAEGLDIEDIVKRKFLRQTIHSTKYEMKKRMKKWPNGYPAKEVEAPPPNVSPKKNKRSGLSAARFPERFDQFGFKLGSKLSGYALRIAAGETSAGIMLKDKLPPNGKFAVYKAAGRVNRTGGALTLPNVTAVAPSNVRPADPQFVPLKPGRKSNGHAPPAHIEMIVHDGKGNEAAIFAGADPSLLQYLLPRVMRKFGLG
jgi:hypothetical protein